MNGKFHKHKLENLIVIPKIVTIHYLELGRGFAYGGESHDFWEIVYADKGGLAVKTDNREFTLTRGEIVFHKPNEFHAHSAAPSEPPNIFIITFECKSEAMRYFENKRLKLPSELKVYIKNIIVEAKRTFKMDEQNPFITDMKAVETPTLGGQQLIRTNLEQLLIMLLRSESRKKASDAVFLFSEDYPDALIGEIVRILTENIYGNIRVADLCYKLHFSKTYLYRVFTQKIGCPVKTYYSKLKIEEAKRLLRQNEHALSEIADMLRFSTLAHFCNSFKKHTGMTPSQYSHSVSTG
jgi:AraC-like DNA-binding protein